MFKWIRKRIHAAIRSKASDESRAPLLRLPQELLDMIVEYLDAPSEVCLSLSNKALCRRLGTDRRKLLRLDWAHRDQRREFLLHLARDNGHLFFCHDCRYLHLVARAGTARAGQTCHCKQRSSLKCIDWSGVDDYPGPPFENYGGDSDYRLNFPHFQLAMARHFGGPEYGLPLKSLSTTEVRIYTWLKVWTLLYVEPKIIDDELFLRVQHWIIFRKDDPPALYRLWGPAICKHIKWVTSSTALDLLQCQVTHVGEKCSTCSKLRQCRYCGVEFQPESRVVGDRVAVIITKWMNLGRAKWPTDPNWQRHVYAPPYLRAEPVIVPKDFQDIKSTFEEHTGKSLAMAIRANAELFRKDLFKRRLHRVGYCQIWKDHRCSRWQDLC